MDMSIVDASDDGGGDDLAHVTKGQGAACNDSSECGTAGGCVDGRCCDTTCTSGCMACNLSGKEGVCSPVAAGSAPTAGHTDCGPDAQSTCKRDGKCDGAGACRNWALGTVCQAGTCNSTTNVVTSDSTCDGNGSCKPGTMITCAPYVCKDTTVCWPSCTSGGSECSAGNVCTGNSCGKKPLGSMCSTSSECQNGTDGAAHCVDGVCCDVACGGTCQYCALSTAKGTCSLVPQNADPRGVCPAGSNTICTPGGCSGTAQACKHAAQNTPCSGTCASNKATDTTCDAAGGCTQTASMTSCGAYACVVGGGGTTASCNNSCANDGDCNQPTYGCNTTTSKCALVLGQTCVAGSDCASGSCAPEGICCTRDCTGQCEACSAAGTCGFVAGTPRSPRLPCTSDANHPMCNGSCSGSSASCSYPTVTCASSTCVFNNSTLEATQTNYACSNGTCSPGNVDCGYYTCNGSVCYGPPCVDDSYCNVFRASCKLDGVTLRKQCEP